MRTPARAEKNNLRPTDNRRPGAFITGSDILFDNRAPGANLQIGPHNYNS